jgi:hypothetical protein
MEAGGMAVGMVATVVAIGVATVVAIGVATVVAGVVRFTGAAATVALCLVPTAASSCDTMFTVIPSVAAGFAFPDTE